MVFHSAFNLTGLDTDGSFWVTVRVRPRFFPQNPSLRTTVSLKLVTKWEIRLHISN